ncbi:hypothetical protein HYC85_002936 [Camellia sinensis]|uniref:WAT1-related protein n=1 Tax=Camellia sinensis TaxID=4442 RepID=A0A7J7IAV9_CAMSI|nr:hypothetical protein HYC85_002936 [Camellia sinensis]
MLHTFCSQSLDRHRTVARSVRAQVCCFHIVVSDSLTTNKPIEHLKLFQQNPAASAQFLSPVQILTPWSTWICLFTGINYSSPTLAAALGNLFPAFTFLLAVLFRMEKFDLRKPSRQAKSLGTIVAVLGAFVMTLYKGAPLLVAILPSNLPHRLLLSQEQPNWVLGGLFLGISCLSSSIWNIVQTATIKEYPDEITVVFFYCFFGTI